MRKIASVFLLVIIMAPVVYLTAWTAYVAGHSDSYVEVAAYEGLMDRSALEKIRHGATRDAVHLLETRLDSHIMGASFDHSSWYKYFPIFSDLSVSYKNMLCKVADYRPEFPSKTDLRETIQRKTAFCSSRLGHIK